MTRILLGQLGSYGDCLYATAVARQIKQDYPGCHLTWGIGSIYANILINNPHVDSVWEYPLKHRDEQVTKWEEFKAEALRRKAAGEFDEVFFTQVFPGGFAHHDGNLRSGIYMGYPNPITVPKTPVVVLTDDEVANATRFVEERNIQRYKHVILFETSPQSGQSSVDPVFAMLAAIHITLLVPDSCVILSGKGAQNFLPPNVFDASGLTYRENAELINYCDLLIGCSSGISWLSLSSWCKKINTIQILEPDYHMHVSIVNDHIEHGLNPDHIIELTTKDYFVLEQCVQYIFNHSFAEAREKYHTPAKIDLGAFYVVMIGEALKHHNPVEVMKCFTLTTKRWGFRPEWLLTAGKYGIKRIGQRLSVC